MKKKFKKIWNNRIFRTFVETLIATLIGYFTCNSIFDLDDKTIISVIVTAIATGLSAIMPLLQEEVDENTCNTK